MKEEWKLLWNSRWLRIVLVAIMLIPSLYAGVFLGSMWDPYGEADKIPVAIVNQDKMVTYQGKKLHVGDDLVINLKKNKAMDFQFMNKEKAKQGLGKGTYYMMITIPKDFSSNATTLLDNNPKQMILHYDTNPGTNYIASKMDDSAVNKIKASISASVTHTYAQTIFQQVKTLSHGLQAASDGAKAAQDGTTKLTAGATTLQENLQVLSNGALSFDDGSQTIQNGLKLYTTGVTTLSQGSKLLQANNQLLNSGMSQLDQGITTLSIGSDQLLQGMKGLSTTLNTQLSSDRIQALNALQQLNKEDASKQALAGIQTQTKANDQAITLLSSLSNLNENDQKYVQGAVLTLQANNTTLNTLYTNMNTLNTTNYETIDSLSKALLGIQYAFNNPNGIISNMNKIDMGLHQTKQSIEGENGLMQGIQSYTGGVDEIATGANALQNNNQTLLTGMAQLSSGSHTLSQGSAQLSLGSISLQDGLTTLENGTTTLATQLASGAQQSNIKYSDKTLSMMSEPVNVSHQELSTVKNNGHAMAPYMMSVGIYVACMAFTLMYPLTKHGNKQKSGIRLWGKKATIMFGVAIMQAIIMVTSLMLFNGLQPDHVLATYLMAILISCAFMAMIVFFNITCGKIGAFLVLIFMVFQLGGAAGTYPIETSPQLYNVIHPYMPFTYSVDAFRHSLSMDGLITNDIIIFVMILLVFSTLSILVYRWIGSMSDDEFAKTKIAQYH